MTQGHLDAAIILAGGLATRMRPLTETIPKSMLEIEDVPFVAYQLRLLRRNSITKVTICAGYLGEQIRDFVGDGSAFDVQVDYSFDGDKLLGTAGAIRKTFDRLPDVFFVLYGDSYLDCDYQAAWHAFAETGKQALMTVYHNEGQWDTSNVEFDGRQILAYSKRVRTERMRHIDYGLGIFRRSVFDLVPEDTPYDLATLYEHLLAQGQLAALEVKTRFYEIGSFSGLEELRAYFRGRKDL